MKLASLDECRLLLIYDMVNMFCMKKYKSLKKLRVGMNRYMGVNWSTTTTFTFSMMIHGVFMLLKMSEFC